MQIIFQLLNVFLLIALILVLFLKKKNVCEFFLNGKKKKYKNYDVINVEIDFIKNFVNTLISHINKNLKNNIYSNEDEKIFKKLVNRINTEKIFFSKNKLTYSFNKGTKIILCPLFSSFNMVKYVIIHELAHIANDKFKHNKKFWCINKKIINEAINANLYVPKNYKNAPEIFCDKLVKNNIYFTNINC